MKNIRSYVHTSCRSSFLFTEPARGVFWADAIECVFAFDACCSIQAFVWRTTIWKFRGIRWRGLCKKKFSQSSRQAVNRSINHFQPINTAKPQNNTYSRVKCFRIMPAAILGINTFKDRVDEK